MDVWNTFQDEQAEWVEFPPAVAAVHQVRDPCEERVIKQCFTKS